MTDDDAPGARLSATHSDETPRYWRETVELYARVRRETPALRREHRRDIDRRLAQGHLRLARFAAHEHAAAAAARHIGRAAVLSPGLVARRAGGVLSGRVARTPG